MRTSRHILIVDDDGDHLQTLCRGLLHLGHVCVPARSAGEALGRLAAEGGEPIDLLLVDLSAPGKPGARVVGQVMSSRPELAVLALTGLAPSSEVLALGARGIRVLKKPFTPEQLGRAIRTALTRHENPKGEGQ